MTLEGFELESLMDASAGACTGSYLPRLGGHPTISAAAIDSGQYTTTFLDLLLLAERLCNFSLGG